MVPGGVVADVGVDEGLNITDLSRRVPQVETANEPVTVRQTW
jgi:hypothetical protein